MYANLSSSSHLLSYLLICDPLALVLGWHKACLVISPPPTIQPYPTIKQF